MRRRRTVRQSGIKGRRNARSRIYCREGVFRRRQARRAERHRSSVRDPRNAEAHRGKRRAADRVGRAAAV